jgi:hypothetical protein
MELEAKAKLESARHIWNKRRALKDYHENKEWYNSLKAAKRGSPNVPAQRPAITPKQ